MSIVVKGASVAARVADLSTGFNVTEYLPPCYTASPEQGARGRSRMRLVARSTPGRSGCVHRENCIGDTVIVNTSEVYMPPDHDWAAALAWANSTGWPWAIRRAGNTFLLHSQQARRPQRHSHS